MEQCRLGGECDLVSQWKIDVIVEENSVMNFRLNRKLKRINRQVKKKLFPGIKMDFEFEKDLVTFYAVDPAKYANFVGAYEFNKRGVVTSYGYADFGQSRMGEDPDFQFVFPLKRGAKNFRKHLNHKAYVMRHEVDYADFLYGGLNSGDCQAMADYLGQLRGAAPSETGVKYWNTEWCIG